MSTHVGEMQRKVKLWLTELFRPCRSYSMVCTCAVLNVSQLFIPVLETAIWSHLNVSRANLFHSEALQIFLVYVFCVSQAGVIRGVCKNAQSTDCVSFLGHSGLCANGWCALLKQLTARRTAIWAPLVFRIRWRPATSACLRTLPPRIPTPLP